MNKRVKQSRPAFSSLNTICIWLFECPLVLLQAVAHHLTADPSTIADDPVKSN